MLVLFTAQEYHNQSQPEDKVTHHWFYLHQKESPSFKLFLLMVIVPLNFLFEVPLPS